MNFFFLVFRKERGNVTDKVTLETEGKKSEEEGVPRVSCDHKLVCEVFALPQRRARTQCASQVTSIIAISQVMRPRRWVVFWRAVAEEWRHYQKRRRVHGAIRQLSPLKIKTLGKERSAAAKEREGEREKGREEQKKSTDRKKIIDKKICYYKCNYLRFL